ncbi:MAG: Cupredoxin-like domain [Candidatus Eremiobacteraeota bacterium]|jgi:plastocyanin|nr:Cupredoxin-like domain [Candidatus Eremiobacteraeota bacterium]
MAARERKITIRPGTPAHFAPSPANVNAGDDVFWDNEDSKPHWPTPAGAAKDYWLDEPIQPHQPSDGISMETGTFTYVCSLHSGETGTIVAS